MFVFDSCLHTVMENVNLEWHKSCIKFHGRSLASFRVLTPTLGVRVGRLAAFSPRLVGFYTVKVSREPKSSNNKPHENRCPLTVSFAASSWLRRSHVGHTSSRDNLAKWRLWKHFRATSHARCGGWGLVFLPTTLSRSVFIPHKWAAPEFAGNWF